MANTALHSGKQPGFQHLAHIVCGYLPPWETLHDLYVRMCIGDYKPGVQYTLDKSGEYQLPVGGPEVHPGPWLNHSRIAHIGRVHDV